MLYHWKAFKEDVHAPVNQVIKLGERTGIDTEQVRFRKCGFSKMSDCSLQVQKGNAGAMNLQVMNDRSPDPIAIA